MMNVSIHKEAFTRTYFEYASLLIQGDLLTPNGVNCFNEIDVQEACPGFMIPEEDITEGDEDIVID